MKTYDMSYHKTVEVTPENLDEVLLLNEIRDRVFDNGMTSQEFIDMYNSWKIAKQAKGWAKELSSRQKQRVV